jgi:hypothetical protein
MDPFKPYQPRQRAVPPPRLTVEGAEAVALQAVAFLVADQELLARFAAVTGCGLEDLSRRITERSFLAGVLDFLLADEAAVLAFANHAELAPETPMLARERLLPSGWE